MSENFEKTRRKTHLLSSSEKEGEGEGVADSDTRKKLHKRVAMKLGKICEENKDKVASLSVFGSISSINKTEIHLRTQKQLEQVQWLEKNLHNVSKASEKFQQVHKCYFKNCVQLFLYVT